MTRLLPFPRTSAFLLVLWLVLNQTLAPGEILLGATLAIIAPLLLGALLPVGNYPRRIWVAAELSLAVLRDIARSNVAVAGIVLGINRREPTSGFVQIPLELRDPAGLAVLATIITATPGSLWADYDSNRGVLLLHVLDLIDENAWIRTIKGRYERRLLEIFQ